MRDPVRQLSLFDGGRPDEAELQARYARLNREWFAGKLPGIRFRFSTRMLAAAQIWLEKREIVLSVAYHDKHGWGSELTGTLKHEMIHLWLHERRRPSGHTPEFRQECERIGAPRWCQPLRRPYKYLYRCPNGHEVKTRRKIPGHSCAECAPDYSPRFALRLIREL